MLEFNTVNELTGHYKDLPKGRSGSLRRTEASKEFKIAAVAFCKKRQVPLTDLAKILGVYSHTPYAWQKLEEPEEVQLAPETNSKVSYDDYYAKADLYAQLAEAMELLELHGFIVTKE